MAGKNRERPAGTNWHNEYELPDGQLIGNMGRGWYFITSDRAQIPIKSDFFDYFDYIAVVESNKRYMIGITGCGTNRWAIGNLKSGRFEVENWTETEDNLVIPSGPHVALSRFGEVGFVRGITGGHNIQIHDPEYD